MSNPRCIKCFHKLSNCYCRLIQSFDPKIRFVILIQYREARRHIATGRLSHLCLQNSELIRGYDYTLHPRVNEILADPRYFPVVLYPGAHSLNLTQLPAASRGALFPKDREPVIFVIDGTWISARKIMQKSQNLHKLPRICFDPPHLSRFRLRKQPEAFCYSTVEAIHQTIELMGTNFQFDIAGRKHDQMLEVFDFMEERQIQLSKNQPRFMRHLAPTHSPLSPS